MQTYECETAEDGVVMPRRFLEQIIMQESLSTIRVLALQTRRKGKSTDGTQVTQHPTNRDHLSRPDERENQLTEPKLRSILPIGIISPDRG